MDQLNYSKIKELLANYRTKYFDSLDQTRKDLFDELVNKINELDSLTSKIKNLVDYLISTEFQFDQASDILTYGSIKVKLRRADPKIPIVQDNVTKAYPKNFRNPISTQQNIILEKELATSATQFYITAHRIIKITEHLPDLNGFRSIGVTNIRNHLIEHPERKRNDSGVTFDSFAYSKNEGPYIKGMRRGDQLKWRDQGFYINSVKFIKNLISALSNALYPDGSNH